MTTPFAIAAWDRLERLPSYSYDSVLAFYQAWVDKSHPRMSPNFSRRVRIKLKTLTPHPPGEGLLRGEVISKTYSGKQKTRTIREDHPSSLFLRSDKRTCLGQFHHYRGSRCGCQYA